MKHSSRPAKLALGCLAILAWLPSASAYTTFAVVETIEWQVADADLVVRGGITDIDEVELDGYPFLRLTVQVKETFKGPADKQIHLVVDADKSGRENLEKLKGRELLLPLVKSQRQAQSLPAATVYLWALRYPRLELYVRVPGVTDLENPEESVPAMDETGRFKHIRQPDAILKIVRESAGISSGPKPHTAHFVKIDPAPPPTITMVNGFTMHGVAGGHHSTAVLLPVDGRLDTLAKRWLETSDRQLRYEGIKALAHFPSPENIEFLKGIYNNDPDHDVETRTREPIPYFPIHLLLEKTCEVRVYPVRKEAYKLLQSWQVDVGPPVIEEPVRGYQGLAVALGAGTALLAVLLLVGWRLMARRRRLARP